MVSDVGIGRGLVGGSLVGWNVLVNEASIKCLFDQDNDGTDELVGIHVELFGTSKLQYRRSCDAYTVCGCQLEIGSHICFVQERFECAGKMRRFSWFMLLMPA
jgi:hypothetical protein